MVTAARSGRPGATAAVLAILIGGSLLLLGLSWLVVALLDAWIGAAVVSLDRAALFWLHDRLGGRLDVLAVEVTYLGSTLVGATAFLVAAVFLWVHRLRVAVLFLGAAFGGGALLSAVLKEIIGRARPDMPGPLPHVFEASFPSGHAIRALVLYAGLAWLVWRLDASPAVRVVTAICAALAVLAIGFSRLYLGVHFPSDVLAGYLLGAAWLAVCTLAARRAGGVTRRTAGPEAGGVTRRTPGSTSGSET